MLIYVLINNLINEGEELYVKLQISFPISRTLAKCENEYQKKKKLAGILKSSHPLHD